MNETLSEVIAGIILFGSLALFCIGGALCAYVSDNAMYRKKYKKERDELKARLRAREKEFDINNRMIKKIHDSSAFGAMQIGLFLAEVKADIEKDAKLDAHQNEENEENYGMVTACVAGCL